MAVAALLLVSAAVAVGVLLAAGVIGSAGDDGSEELARLEEPIDRLMDMRDQFFSAERDYLAAYGFAQRRLENYKRQYEQVEEEYEQIEQEYSDEFDTCYRYAAVECPEPDYPDYPDVPTTTRQTEQFRRDAVRLEELATRLLASSRPTELRALHARLSEATDTLLDEIQHNADVLDEAVESGEGEGEGYLDEGKLRTLRADTALPIVVSMNQAALALLRKFEIPRKQYDVPGGSDLDNRDHSDLVKVS